jgi:hypothetical protein
MDSRLQERITNIESQLEALHEAEHKYLLLEANSKFISSQLFLSAEGKSVAEREAIAYSSKKWIEFSLGQVEAEANFHHERRKYDVALKAYDGEHLSFKNEYQAIKRQA